MDSSDFVNYMLAARARLWEKLICIPTPHILSQSLFE